MKQFLNLAYTRILIAIIIYLFGWKPAKKINNLERIERIISSGIWLLTWRFVRVRDSSIDDWLKENKILIERRLAEVNTATECENVLEPNYVKYVKRENEKNYSKIFYTHTPKNSIYTQISLVKFNHHNSKSVLLYINF
jgi:hypothetical protein